MLVFIYAYEGLYQGLHGIEDYDVIDVNDNIKIAREEINEWGREASNELIYSFGLEKEYMRRADIEDMEELDEEDWVDMTDGCGWEAYKIKEEISLSLEELQKEASRLGKKLFISQYCEESDISYE